MRWIVSGALLGALCSSISYATNVSGNVSGHWTLSASPYIVTADITIPSGQTLLIDPGVVVEMSPGANFSVDGILQSAGTSANPVIITSLQDGTTNAAPGQWGGIIFDHSDLGNQLQNTAVRYGGNALQVLGSTLTLTNVQISSASNISLMIQNGSNVTLNQCALLGAQDGIYLNSGSTATVIGSLLQGSQDAGIEAYGGSTLSNLYVTASTITANSGRAFYVDSSLTQVTLSGNHVYGNGLNGIDLRSANIQRSTVWLDQGIPYILDQGTLAIGTGGSLTIEAGVVVKSLAGSNLTVQDGGSLVTLGTPTSPVTFTSLFDDTIGGDTNDDGSKTTPAAGNWGGISFINSPTPNLIQHTQLRYGGSARGLFALSGSSATFIGVQISSYIGEGVDIQNGSQVTMTDCVTSGGDYGVVDDGGTLLATNVQTLNATKRGFELALGSTATLQGCLMKGSAGYGLYAYDGGGVLQVTGSTITANAVGAVQLDPSETVFNFSGNSVFGNAINGIILTGAALTGPTLWSDQGMPYVLSGITVDSGGILTITQGAILKSFGGQGAFLTVRNKGRLISSGTAARPVIFTSLRDDSAEGDTNNDGSATQPAVSDWGRVEFDSSDGNQITNTIFRWGQDMLYPVNSTATFSNVTISSAGAYGMDVIGKSNVTVSNSMFSYNGNTTNSNQGGIYYAGPGAQLNVSASQFIANTPNGLRNVSGDGGVPEMRDNYWGAASGPTNPSNPAGTGQLIDGSAHFIPFWSTPTGGEVNPSDILPPRTTLVLSAQNYGKNPILISTQTLIGFSTVDDLVTVNDGQGVGAAQTNYAIDGGTFTVFTSSFTLSVPGPHTISYFSTDLQGHVEVASNTLVSVDTAAAVTRLTYIPAPYVTSSSDVYISGSAGVYFDFNNAVPPRALTLYTVDGTLPQSFGGPFNLSEGSHTLTYQSQDVLGNWEVLRSSGVNVDATSPLSKLTINPTVGSLLDGSVLITPLSNFTLSAGDVVQHGVLSGVANIQVAIDSGTFSVYSSTFHVTAQGRHTLRWFSQDNVGNAEVVQSTTVVISTAAAPVTQLSYAGTYFIDGSSQTYISSNTLVGFAVNDHGNGTLFTHYWIDASTATAFQTLTSSFSLTEGVHQIQFQSQDLLGNLEPLGSAALLVDGTAPASHIAFTGPLVASAPAGGFFISTATAISFSGVDPVSTALTSGFKNIQVSLDGSPFTTYPTPLTVTTEGPHTLVWFSQDNVGNAEVIQSTRVVVDATPPTFQIVFSPDGVVDAVGHVTIDTASVVAFQIQDALSGFATANYRIDGSSSTPFLVYQSTFSLSVGTHTLAANASDRIGNLKTVAPFTITVGTAAPATGGSPDPTGGTLPDGTPVIASPTPLPVPFPGSPSTETVLPTVQAVSFSPVPPVGRGPLNITVRFSAPMDNTVYPIVTLAPSGQAPVGVSLTRYVGDTWQGTLTVTSDMNSGAAVLSVTGARDPAGHAAAQSVTPFPIQIVLPAAPNSVTAVEQDAQLELSWAAVPTASAYNVYRATWAFTSRNGLTPIAGGLPDPALTDFPSPDIPTYYYAVSAVESDGAEGPSSPAVAAPMPLPPAITLPADHANVDFSSTVIQGIAQPGTMIDLSIPTSSGVLASVTVNSMSTWSAHLTLGYGPFEVSAHARSTVTGQVSASSATVRVTVIDFPIAPALTAAAGDTTISLSWTATTQQDVIGYNLYRDGATVPLNAAPIPATQTTFQDIALTDGRSYRYLITSVRTGAIESLPSNSVQATPVAGPGWGTP